MPTDTPFRPVTIEDTRVVEHRIPPHVQAVMGRLRRWANRLRGRYGVPIYLCGSALRADNPDPRDWDVRIMLPDEQFALAFGPVDEWRDEGCTGEWTRTRFRWSDQCVKDTQDFAAWCHLNGDVQIYPESHAATMYAQEPRLRLDTFPDPAEPDLLDRLATAEAERDRLLRQIARVRACPCISGASCDELDTLYDLAAGRAPSTGTTPP